MAKRARGTNTGNVQDRRSIKVPDEIWKYVERWAEEQDKSEAAIIRSLIEATVRNSTILAAQAVQLELYIATAAKLSNDVVQNCVNIPNYVEELRAIGRPYEQDRLSRLKHIAVDAGSLAKDLRAFIDTLPQEPKAVPAPPTLGWWGRRR